MLRLQHQLRPGTAAFGPQCFEDPSKQSCSGWGYSPQSLQTLLLIQIGTAAIIDACACIVAVAVFAV